MIKPSDMDAILANNVNKNEVTISFGDIGDYTLDIDEIKNYVGTTSINIEDVLDIVNEQADGGALYDTIEYDYNYDEDVTEDLYNIITNAISSVNKLIQQPVVRIFRVTNGWHSDLIRNKEDILNLVKDEGRTLGVYWTPSIDTCQGYNIDGNGNYIFEGEINSSDIDPERTAAIMICGLEDEIVFKNHSNQKIKLINIYDGKTKTRLNNKEINKVFCVSENW